jgi:hypothetical protein
VIMLDRKGVDARLRPRKGNIVCSLSHLNGIQTSHLSLGASNSTFSEERCLRRPLLLLLYVFAMRFVFHLLTRVSFFRCGARYSADLLQWHGVGRQGRV